jgi:hypothetical protein
MNDLASSQNQALATGWELFTKEDEFRVVNLLNK